MIKVFNRLRRYLKEVGYALRVGVTLKDKFALAFWTLAFHARLGGGQTMEAAVRIGGLTPRLRLRVGGGDLFILYEILMDGVYNVPVARLLGEPKIIVDLGANVGIAALAMAAQFPKARVVCVEPHPETAALLRYNLACLGDRANAIEAAVSGEPGIIRLNLATEHYNASVVLNSANGVNVRAMTIEQVMVETGICQIDILKMDIEGAEKLILPAQPHWLQSVGFLTVELHHGYSFADFARDLAPARLVVEHVGVAQAIAHRTRAHPAA